MYAPWPAVCCGCLPCVVAGVGYLAYAWMNNGPDLLSIRTPVVLSDPLCDAQHFGAIAQAFVEQHPETMFAQVGTDLPGCCCCLRAMHDPDATDTDRYRLCVAANAH